MSFTVNNTPALSFAENFPDHILSEVDAAVYLTVSLNNRPIVSDMKLIADSDKRIIVPIRQLLRTTSALARPKATTAPLPRVSIKSVKGDESLTLGGWVLPGGIDEPASFEISDFILRNFLTWQPQVLDTTAAQPQWLAFVRPYSWQRFEIFSSLHCVDGRKYTRQIASTPDTYTYTQIDTSFGGLWEAFCSERELSPLAYDVFGQAEKRVTSSDGVTTVVREQNCPMAQRYVLRPPREGEECFGFVNTLGGFDTLMMQGAAILKPSGEIETFTSREVERELSSGYTSYWEASTGYIDTEHAAAQYQDFLKSRDRWVFRAGRWLRIVVDEYKLEHTQHELNAYTFKYHLAERNERRFYERSELPEVELPIIL